jgi:hypothetical protein
MKKLIWMCLVLLLFLCCKPAIEEIERYTEDGVEVVVNHLDPYKLAGEPIHFYLEERLTIDTENENIAETGLTDIFYFDVDADGNIYFLNNESQENFMLKFDRNGSFVTAFGRMGQGPGELQMPIIPIITNKGEVLILDEGQRKLCYFTKEGDFINSVPQEVSTIVLFPMENEKYLTVSAIFDPESDYIMQYPFSLFSSDFKQIKELDSVKFPNYLKGKKQKAINTGFLFSITKRNIYIGNEERGYEINVYDLEGNLVRKIRKDYRKVRIPEEYIEEHSEGMGEIWKQRTYFPEYFPPFQCAFVDDKGRLFVITNEKGSRHGEYMCDIFNPEGIFIARAGVTGIVDTPPQIYLPPIVKKNLLYCIEEKESGYKKFVVYEMKWE